MATEFNRDEITARVRASLSDRGFRTEIIPTATGDNVSDRLVLNVRAGGKPAGLVEVDFATATVTESMHGHSPTLDRISPYLSGTRSLLQASRA